MLESWKRPADTPDSEQPLSIATHEAGHAVASALEGLSVDGLKMTNTAGVTWHAGSEDPEVNARVSASGYAAEALFQGFIWYDPLIGGEEDDFGKYKQCYPHLTPDEAATAFHALIAKQVERLRGYEDLIATLAGDLLEALEFEDGALHGDIADEYLREIPLYARRIEQDHADWLWRMGLDEYRTTCDM